MTAPAADSATAAAVASIIDGHTAPTPQATNPLARKVPENNNPSAPKGRGRPPVDPSKRSQSAAAIYARERREKRKQQQQFGSNAAPAPTPAPPSPTAGERFTPAQLRHDALPAGGPVTVVHTPEEIDGAVKSVAMVIGICGYVAALIAKNDAMRVEKDQATETALIIVDGYPDEVIQFFGGDGKKGLAWMAGGTLVGEKIIAYRAGTPAASSSIVAPPQQREPTSLPVAAL